jgi:Mor family transcriptional regulator
MSNDILLLKPLSENIDEFLLYLSKKFEMDIKLIQQMSDYFKDDFYLILSLFAGSKIIFPSVKELNQVKIKIAIYKEFKEKVSNTDLSALLEDMAEKYKTSQNQIYTIYTELKEILC